MQTDWKESILGCFGSADRKFAGHPYDLERAGELLGKCLKDNVSLEELLEEVEHSLKTSLDFENQTEVVKKNIQEHIEKEKEKVKEKFEDWLDE